jgi:hypothetical protein
MKEDCTSLNAGWFFKDKVVSYLSAFEKQKNLFEQLKAPSRTVTLAALILTLSSSALSSP